MPEEMPRGERKALYKHKSVHSRGTIGIVWSHLITSLMYPCIPRPPYVTLDWWIHEYPPLSSVSLSDWVVSKYILPSCSFTKYPQSSRFYSFEEINQEINDAAVEALPPWKPHSRPRRTWGTRTMTSRGAAWTQRGRSRESGETGTRAWSCTSTPGVKQGSSDRAQCPHIWNRKC